jgi:hypothetical protein
MDWHSAHVRSGTCTGRQRHRDRDPQRMGSSAISPTTARDELNGAHRERRAPGLRPQMHDTDGHMHRSMEEAALKQRGAELVSAA